jgi:hypothetical protein
VRKLGLLTEAEAVIPPRRCSRCRPEPRVRPHCRFRNRGAEFVSVSGMKWMSGSAKRQCDRALPEPPTSASDVPALEPPPSAAAASATLHAPTSSSNLVQKDFSARWLQTQEETAGDRQMSHRECAKAREKMPRGSSESPSPPILSPASDCGQESARSLKACAALDQLSLSSASCSGPGAW